MQRSVLYSFSAVSSLLRERLDMAMSFGLTALIHESDTISIYRGHRTSDMAPVIIKSLKQQHPKPNDVAKLKYERLVAADLALPGIVKPYGIEKIGDHLALVMEDIGGVALSSLVGGRKLSLKQLLQVAISIADTLGAIHARGLIHRDIKPHNVIINVERMEVKLSDFGSATYLSHEVQTAGQPRAVEGTLSYMSPEQTGRTNRAVDTRSDLYSFGITLYELLTGGVPFRTADALELVHSHIARIPQAPKEVSPEVPSLLSDIIMKLLAKSPDDRYQSAYGLEADLQECLAQLESHGSIASFPLGRLDMVADLRMPQKLYGREQELQSLMDTWGRASRDAIELLLVSGYSGIGKSVLVYELHKPIVQSKGYFIAGKFDQLNRSVPYAAVASAFREIVRTILTESDAKLVRWKEKLRIALGASGGLLTDIIPELELLIGPQPSVPALAPTESQNRFDLTFYKFCQTLATKEHPLVLFLDDVQWVDPASLKFIQFLLTQADMRHMLVIAAYRDNEVDENHMFSLALADLRKARVAIHEITLRPLTMPVVNQIIADTLSSTPERTASLVDVVFAKTRGNPFFMHQFMKTLHSDKLLSFDGGVRLWSWDLTRIREMQVAENVVDFMAGKLRRLSESAQRVLRLAACIGHQFDLRTLSIIDRTELHETARALSETLQGGFIWALDANSRFLYTQGEADAVDVEIAAQISYRFSHDRVQQAAYSLIDAKDRQELHLRIGRLLLDSSTKEPIENALFDILHHMNLGISLISDPSERLRLSSLNLEAGKRAKLGLAYEAAKNYFRSGVSLLALDGEGWADHYELSFALRMGLAECELLTGAFPAAEEILSTCLSQANTTFDKVNVHNLRMLLSQMSGKFNDAVSAVLAGLALLGVEIPGADQRGALFAAELAEIHVNMKGRKPADLIDLPEVVEPEQLAAQKLLADLVAAAMAPDPTLGAFAIAKQVNHSIKHGHSNTSAFGYMLYARLLLGGMGSYEDAYEFAKLGIALTEKYNNVRLSSLLTFTFATMLHFYEPVGVVLKWLSRARHAAIEAGDFRTLSYTCYCTIWTRLSVGDDLESVSEENEQFLALTQRAKDTTGTHVMLCTRQIIKSLKGETTDPLSWSDDSFDEQWYASEFEKPEYAYFALWYSSVKLTQAYLFGDYDAALTHLAAAEKATTPAWAMDLFATEIPFYACLTMLAVHDSVPAAEQEQYRSKIDGHLSKLAALAVQCPSNYDHKYKLVMAERARISGEQIKAMALYDEAIASAEVHEFPRDEAMANEIAARYHLEKGRLKCARAYATDAYHGYLAWGGSAKATHLASKIPEILSQSMATATQTERRKKTGTTSSSYTSSSLLSTTILDVETAIRAAQSLAGEVVLENVMTQLIDITTKNAGAQRGVLILDKNGSLMVEATLTVDPPISRVGLAIPLDNATDIPLTIVQYVARTREHVILGDAARDLRFASDPYFAKRSPKSILCIAMGHQGRSMGVFYLENNLSSEAFTAARVELLKLLLVQAAIAVENARLYKHVQSRTAELRNAELQIRHEFEERERSDQARAQLQEEIIRVQNARLAELSTPLIPITDRIMVMPLIGMMDNQRAQDVLHTTLEGVQANNAEVVIIDITGIKLVDSDVVTTLIATTNALRLLGAQAVITGIRADVAQKLIELQVDFGAMVTKSTLQSGFAYALKRTGRSAAFRASI
jgi:predicted ATPase/GAF domain-containing protein/anti-anti-sigma regulatory factor